MEFFVKRKDKVNGPFTLAQIKSGIKKSKLKLSDSFSNSKDGPWQRLSPKFIRLVTADDKQADEVDPFEVLPDKSKPKSNKKVAHPKPAEPTDQAVPESSPPVQEPAPESPAPKKVIDCSDCGGKVSRRAKSCIHCGAPLQEEPAPAPAAAMPSQRVDVISDTEPFVVQTWDSRGAVKCIDSDRQLYDDEAVARVRFNATGTCVLAAGQVLTDVNGNEYFMQDEMGYSSASGSPGEAFSVNVNVHHRNWHDLPFRLKVYPKLGDVPVCNRPPLSLVMVNKGVTPEVAKKMQGWLGWKQEIKMCIANGVNVVLSDWMSVADHHSITMENSLNKNLTPKILIGENDWLMFDTGFGVFGEPMNWTCNFQCTDAKGSGYYEWEPMINHPNVGLVDDKFRFKKLDVVKLG
ncbi:MAG: hypothetical protein GY924_27210 [Planctomycetaceae bacterium]|nr:hypothetical protein [Planctomycetaceae bacterium]